MASTTFVAQVLPGQTSRLKTLASALNGERRNEFERSQRQLGILGEDWFLRESAEGDSVVVWIEAPDIGRSMEAMARSRDPLDVWMKREIAAITGVDYEKPPTGAPFQSILQYRANDMDDR